MKHPLVALGFLAMLTTTASAGGYLGLALGTQPVMNDELEVTPTGRSIRVLGGGRFGNISIEAALGDFGVTSALGDFNVVQLSAAVKPSFPLGNEFEAFGRAGIERTWVNDYAGNGFQLGGGFEYRFKLGATGASVFVDYTVHRAGLESPLYQHTEWSRMWGLGFTLSL
jgi:hypothetical protein